MWLETLRSHTPAIGTAWIFPSPKDPSRPCSLDPMMRWWRRMEMLAGLRHTPGMGWHSLRRKFATSLRDQPLRVLCDLRGWRDPETVVRCYQRSDQSAQRAALAERQRVETSGWTVQADSMRWSPGRQTALPEA